MIPKIEEYIERGGITDLVCSLPLAGVSTQDIRASMRLFAREVMPHFRGAAKDAATADRS